jgi:hypothetical protein
MTRRLVILSLFLVAVGCSSSRKPGEGDAMFGPISMRIHPIFTQVKDWTGDGKPDGIEALIEFSDRFEDPTKASGRIIFHLHEYRRDFPDPRGKLVSELPWIGEVQTLAQQKEHWSRTSGTYSFRLAYAQVASDKDYVLAAMFERTGGGRFFDKIVLTAQSQEIKRVGPATLPGTMPHGGSPLPHGRTPQP